MSIRMTLEIRLAQMKASLGKVKLFRVCRTLLQLIATDHRYETAKHLHTVIELLETTRPSLGDVRICLVILRLIGFVRITRKVSNRPSDVRNIRPHYSLTESGRRKEGSFTRTHSSCFIPLR